VEHVEVPAAAAAGRLRLHAPQQGDVALGVEADDGVAAADVLGDQQLGKAGLADAGGAQHEGVADPVGGAHQDSAPARLDPVQAGVAAVAALAGGRRRAPEPWAERARGGQLRDTMGLVEALGVLGQPAEALTQIDATLADGHALRTEQDPAARNQAQAIAHDDESLNRAREGHIEENRDRDLAGGRGAEQERLRVGCHQGGGDGADEGGNGLDRLPEQPLSLPAHALIRLAMCASSPRPGLRGADKAPRRSGRVCAACRRRFSRSGGRRAPRIEESGTSSAPGTVRGACRPMPSYPTVDISLNSGVDMPIVYTSRMGGETSI